jgi:uncharacterized protein YhfF
MEYGVKPALEHILARYPGAQTYRPGDSAQLNAEIIALMRSGKKTATCAALAEFAEDPDAMPRVGRVDIALDWNDDFALATRTLSVEEIAYSRMDASRIPPQGEFGSLEEWRKGYAAYLGRGGWFDPEVVLVYERFEVIEDLTNGTTS